MQNIFQFIFLFLSLIALWVIAAKKRHGDLSARAMFFWMLLWICADVAVLIPNATTIIANILGIGRGTDLVLYLFVVITCVILFRLHVKIETLQRDITKVVRGKALKDL